MIPGEYGVAHLDERSLAVTHDIDAALGCRFFIQEGLDYFFVVKENIHVPKLAVEVFTQVPERFAFFLAQVFEREDLRKGCFEKEFCRGQILDVLALQELVQYREGVIFGFLVLFLRHENFEVQQVYRAREVRMQVALLVRVLFKNVEEAERLVVFLGFIGDANKSKDVLDVVVFGIERETQLASRSREVYGLRHGRGDLFAENHLFKRTCDTV